MSNGSNINDNLSIIFSSLSVPIRVNIIKSLNEHTQLTFMELLRALNLNPTKDASALSYHLKKLVNSNIINKLPDSKYYSLTTLGKTIANFLGAIRIYLTSRVPITIYDYSELTVDSLQDTISKLISSLPLELDNKSSIVYTIYDLLIKAGISRISLHDLVYLLFSQLIKEGVPPDSLRTLTQLGPHTFSLKLHLLNSKSTDYHENLTDFFIKTVHVDYLTNYLPPLLKHLFGTRTFFVSSENLLIGPETSYFNTIFLIDTFLKAKKTNLYSSSLMSVLNYLVALYYGDYRVKNVIFDDFNIALAPLIQSMSYKELKGYFLNFLYTFSNLSTHKTLSLNLSLYESKKVESYKYPAHVLSVDEYEDEANMITIALIDAYNTLSIENPLLNPLIFLRISKGNLDILPNDYLSVITRNIYEEKGNNILFINTSPPWQNEFIAYSAHGQRFSYSKHIERNLNNAITLGINLFNLFKEAQSNETLFFDLLNRVLSDIALFLDSLSEIPSFTFKEQATKQFPVTYTISKEQKRLFLVGLNELTQSVTGGFPWKNKSSLKFCLKLLSQIDKMIASNLAHQNVFLMATYPPSFSLSYYVDINDKHNFRLFSTETVNRQTSYESFLKMLRYESQLQPKFPGGHYFGIQIQKRIPKEKINNLLAYILKTPIGMFSFVRQKTLCTNCNSTYLGITDTCPMCGSRNLLYNASLNAPPTYLTPEYKRLIKSKNIGFLEYNF